MKTVTLYSLSTCPACRKVKKFLDENGISHTTIDVDMLDGSEQWAATKELSKHNPASSYPTVIITEAIVGPDIEALKAKLS
jgi:glutaredoxin